MESSSRCGRTVSTVTVRASSISNSVTYPLAPNPETKFTQEWISACCTTAAQRRQLKYANAVMDELRCALGNPEVTFGTLEQPGIQSVDDAARFFRDAGAAAHARVARLRAFPSRSS